MLEFARPDVFGRRREPPGVIVGEAKTRWDIEVGHTQTQLVCYFDYLKEEVNGELWLAVPWAGLDAMYFYAGRCRRLSSAQHIPFQVTGVALEAPLFSRTVRA